MEPESWDIVSYSCLQNTQNQANCLLLIIIVTSNTSTFEHQSFAEAYFTNDYKRHGGIT